MPHQIYLPTLRALRQQLSDLDAQRQKVLHAINAIQDLPDPPEGVSDPSVGNGGVESTKTTEESPSYADAAVSILEDRGKPMHIDEITEAAKARGWYSDKDFGERGDRNSFIGGLDRNARNGRLFHKPAPATYALLAWRSGAENEEKPQGRRGIRVED